MDVAIISPLVSFLFQSYEEEIVKKYYLVYIVLPHLESLHSSRLSVTIFVEHNPFCVINSSIEVDVKYVMLFEKCSNECSIQFCSHKWTSKTKNNFILTSSILSELMNYMVRWTTSNEMYDVMFFLWIALVFVGSFHC